MRPWIGAACAWLLVAPPAAAQHSPRLSDASELGAELVLADNLISLAAVFQKPLGATTDARLGVGLADPDNSDSDRFARVGLRAFIGAGSRRFPFDKAIEGELDVTVGEDRFRLSGGPSFGYVGGGGGRLISYVQPLFLYTHDTGTSDVKLALRVGADYPMSRIAELRGDLVLSSQMALRAAVYVDLPELLRGRRRPASRPPAPPPPAPPPSAPSS